MNHHYQYPSSGSSGAAGAVANNSIPNGKRKSVDMNNNNNNTIHSTTAASSFPPPPTQSALTAAPSSSVDMSHYHLPKSQILPIYKYSTSHKHKSWKEMIHLFEKFVEREGHGDVERDDPSLILGGGGVSGMDGAMIGMGGGGSSMSHQQSKKKGDGVTKKENGDSEQGDIVPNDTTDKEDAPLNSSSLESDDRDDVEDDEMLLLMLRSWVREIRWIIRAEGLIQEENKMPQRTTKPASSSSNGNNNNAQQQQQRQQRCDSENVALKGRLQQLESMPHFPLHVNGSSRSNNNNNGQSSNNRSAFQKWLDDLMHYRAKHADINNKGGSGITGDCNVPLKYPDYPGLGNFVNRQRTEYRKLLQGKASSMTASKIQQLDRVGFIWSIREGGHASWESRLSELVEYQRTFGNTNVPKNYPPNPSLGYWVNEQRFQYRRLIKGKTSYMNQNKISHLNGIGFKWTLRESKRPWNEWMEELRQYKVEHGHVNVPLKYERNVPLGSFVNNQRSEYRRYKNNNSAAEKNGSKNKQQQQQQTTSMTEERIRELEQMGFLWNVRDARTPWSVRLEELQEYKKMHGNCDVPNHWPMNQPLSHWVAKQRQQYKLYIGRSRGGGGRISMTCHLTAERVKQLDEIGFDWRYPTAVIPKDAFIPPPSRCADTSAVDVAPVVDGGGGGSSEVLTTTAAGGASGTAAVTTTVKD
ncbi:hypothetical protein ACHAXR_006878 [Thalassiosira sp. AJA248-18]